MTMSNPSPEHAMHSHLFIPDISIHVHFMIKVESEKRQTLQCAAHMLQT